MEGEEGPGKGKTTAVNKGGQGWRGGGVKYPKNGIVVYG